MKTSLDHLPSRKRRELAFVVQRLREAHAAVAPSQIPGKLLKIILYGSYARGGWVDDHGSGYHSDFDILLVVDREELTDMVEVWATVDDLLVKECQKADVLRTPVSLIAHTLDDVNDMLRRGRAFFLDIVRDGIVLHDGGGELISPAQIQPAVALKEALEYRRTGLEGAEAFLHGSRLFRERGRNKEVVYALHQAAERLYETHALVMTLYSPKTHNLNRLRHRSEALDPELAAIWATEDKLGRQAYERLREAYVKARHSRAYEISELQLDWLSDRIGRLKAQVEAKTLDYLARRRQEVS